MSGHDTDVIVIGGGHNGLVCAAYLARAGVSVTVLEARDSVGGCASTVDALGARVNICNCDHLAVRGMPLVDELELERHGLRYLELDPAMMGLMWDGSPWFLFHDLDRTVAGLDLTHPDQAAGYRDYVRRAREVGRLVSQVARGVPRPAAVTRAMARQRGRGLATLLRWNRMSAREVLGQFLSSDELAGPMMVSGPVVWGVSPSWPGTGLGAIGPAMKHLISSGRPVGGSGALTDAVAAALVEAKGSIRTGARVDGILVERADLIGVRLAGGEIIRAPRVVVASDPRVALVEWLSGAPSQASGLLERWRAMEPAPGYESKIDAVIREVPRYRSLDRLDLDAIGVSDPLVPTAYVTPDLNGIDRAHRLNTEGRVAERPIFLANVPSVVDESLRTPEGHHVFSLETLYTPYGLIGGWPDSSEPERWLECFAELVEPGFLDSIVDWRVMTPARYEAEFHMPLGHATSFAGGPVSALLGREPELTRYRTPVPGLFLTGAATFPGAGVWGAPGRNAAQVVLDDLS